MADSLTNKAAVIAAWQKATAALDDLLEVMIAAGMVTDEVLIRPEIPEESPDDRRRRMDAARAYRYRARKKVDGGAP